MKFQLWYPLKPLSVNQPFGGNATYYARFHDQFGNPEKGHNGIDMAASHGTPVYASCDGVASFAKDDHGGEGMIITTAPFDYKDTQACYHVIYWHLIGNTDPKYPSPISLDTPTPVKVGDLIGYADNTGAPFESSGDHLHFGLCPYDLNGNVIEAHNGFNGCIEATPYFNKFYAVDKTKVEQIQAELEQVQISLYQQIINSLKEKISKFFK